LSWEGLLIPELPLEVCIFSAMHIFSFLFSFPSQHRSDLPGLAFSQDARIRGSVPKLSRWTDMSFLCIHIKNLKMRKGKKRREKK
jgi:hypothetical protein